MNELALFAGAGGGILGGHLLGWRCVCAVEIEDYPRRVLLARQRDGMLPRFPIWDDVTTFDGTQWRGRVDVISGGFPCQDISAAGKGAGITGARSGLWSHMARVIGEVGPRFVYVENSPMLISRGIEAVLGDLAALGYMCRWGIVGAHHTGAPHKRDRIWIRCELADARHARIHERRGAGAAGRSVRLVRGNEWHGLSQATEEEGEVLANACCRRCGGSGCRENEQPGRAETQCAGETLADADITHGKRNKCTKRGNKKPAEHDQPSWWISEPDVGRVAHGVASRVDRLRAIGNGQVPGVAALAWEILSNG